MSKRVILVSKKKTDVPTKDFWGKRCIELSPAIREAFPGAVGKFNFICKSVGYIPGTFIPKWKAHLYATVIGSMFGGWVKFRKNVIAARDLAKDPENYEEIKFILLSLGVRAGLADIREVLGRK